MQPNLLDDPTARHIFTTTIVPAMLDGRTAHQQPVAILVGGQPALLR